MIIMETIQENLHRNTTLGWAVAIGTEWAGCHISAGHKQFYLSDGEGANEHNKFLCHSKCRHTALPG